MTVLRVAGEPDLPDTGWLFDDASLFGVLSRDGGTVPRLDGWTAADVAERAATKAGAAGLDEDGWWLVADVAAGCETLAEMRPGRAAEAVCAQTFAAAWELSSHLPHPPRSLRGHHDPRLSTGSAHVVATLEVRDAATRLTNALTDDGYTDTDALAGWVHDAMFGLVLCRRALRESLGPVPVPPVGLTSGAYGDRRRPGGTGRTSVVGSRGRRGPRAEVSTPPNVTRPCSRARAPVTRLYGTRPERPGPHAA